MSGAMLEKDSRPWYQQGWPWLLIALPASAVIGGILTIILAVKSPNALVVDDYYKQGLAINQQKHRLAQADNLNLSGLLRSDGSILSLELESGHPLSDTPLTLNVIHATRSDLDRTLLLQRDSNGSYRATLASPLPAGSWYLQLQDQEKTWELRSRISVDGPFQAHLTAED